MTETEFLFVYVTAGSKEEAKAIASEAVKKNLAACANILPSMTSVYQWQGQVETAEETVLILKTTREKFAPLNRLVLELHSYDCPCITALPVSDGHSDFLDWIRSETKTPKRS